jgi:Tol biopolymer transport system component
MRRAGLGALLVLAALTAGPPAHAAFPGANGKVLYVGGQGSPRDGGSIYVIDSDGSGETMLTTHEYGESADHDPAWSPDGRKIAFGRCCPTSATQVWVMNPDGTGQAPVGGGREPAWSPDGQRIAFQNGGIWLMNADGSGPARVVETPCEQPPPDPPGQYTVCGIGSHAWSPDGKRIAFSVSSTFCVEPEPGDPPLCTYEGTDLWVAQVDGTGLTRLTSTSNENEDEPNWSPDGEWIAFESAPHDPDFDQPDDISIMRPDGTDRAAVTNSSEDEGNPAWSPDGRKFVFERDAPFTDNGIWTMDADGGGQVALTPPEPRVNRSSPDWQPLTNLGPNPYPRPAFATPIWVPLVPAYSSCTTPNSVHVAPLAQPSCAPPAQESALLTSSSIGRGAGYVRLAAITGDLSTPADDADMAIAFEATDVVRKSNGSDYTGSVIVSISARITDRNSGFGGAPATVNDTTLHAPAACTPTAGPSGGRCTLSTTWDTLVPGMFVESKRTVFSAQNVRVLDVGPNGTGTGAGCPPTCGDGDEATILTQGLFTP